MLEFQLLLAPIRIQGRNVQFCVQTYHVPRKQKNGTTEQCNWERHLFILICEVINFTAIGRKTTKYRKQEEKSTSLLN